MQPHLQLGIVKRCRRLEPSVACGLEQSGRRQCQLRKNNDIKIPPVPQVKIAISQHRQRNALYKYNRQIRFGKQALKPFPFAGQDKILLHKCCCLCTYFPSDGSRGLGDCTRQTIVD
jgi:hypothetical protein